MTEKEENEILEAARRIMERRKDVARLAAFRKHEQVMIRWDNPGSSFGESYTGIMVPREELDAIVEGHFAKRIGRSMMPS